MRSLVRVQYRPPHSVDRDTPGPRPARETRPSAESRVGDRGTTAPPASGRRTGPGINDGFYYDFQLPRALTPADLQAIEERMGASVAADHPFVRREVPFDEGRAIEEKAGQSFKVEILDDLARKAQESGTALPPVSFFEHGPFEDLCKGPHVESTGHIGPFKLLAVAGAYWRGDEKRPMLQR